MAEARGKTMNSRFIAGAALASALIAVAVGTMATAAAGYSVAVGKTTVATVDGSKIANPAPGDWLSNGRSYSEQRFSPLTGINTGNVSKLGVAWEYRTYSVRALEGTP